MEGVMRTLISACIVMASVGIGAQDQTVYKPGNGVTLPAVVKQVKAEYTQEAMDAHIEGTVGLQVVVLADGAVGDVKIAQSLDPTYGLDQQAVKAIKQWQFKPGTKDGKAVAVQVDVMIRFTLK
jgi:TonB family protein